MATSIQAGFQIGNIEPVDARFTVANESERLGFAPDNVYNGLVVYQQDTQQIYVLTDANNSNQNSSWRQIDTLKSSVRYYGAVGDGVTNDYTAISESLSNNTNIYFPSGSYVFSGSLSPQNKTLIFEQGAKLIPSGSTTSITINKTNQIVNNNDNILFSDVFSGSLIWNTPQTIYVNWFESDVEPITGNKDIGTAFQRLRTSIGNVTAGVKEDRVRCIKLVGSHYTYTSINLTDIRAQGVDFDFSEATINAVAAVSSSAGSKVFELNKYPVIDYSKSHIGGVFNLGNIESSGLLQQPISGINNLGSGTIAVTASLGNHILSPGDFVNIFGWSGSANYGGETQFNKFWINGHYMVEDTGSDYFIISKSFEDTIDTSTGDFYYSILPKVGLLLARGDVKENGIYQFVNESGSFTFKSGSIKSKTLEVISDVNTNDKVYYGESIWTSSIDDNTNLPPLPSTVFSRAKFSKGQILISSDGNLYQSLSYLPSVVPDITASIDNVPNYSWSINTVTTGSLGVIDLNNVGNYKWYLVSGSKEYKYLDSNGVEQIGVYDTANYTFTPYNGDGWVESSITKEPGGSAGVTTFIGELIGYYGLSTVYNLASEENRMTSPLFLQNLEPSAPYTFYASWAQQINDFAISKFNYLNAPPRASNLTLAVNSGDQTSEAVYLDDIRVVGNSKNLVYIDSFDKVSIKDGFWAGGDDTNLYLDNRFKDTTAITIDGHYPHPNGNLECINSLYIDVTENSIRDLTYHNPRFSAGQVNEVFSTGSSLSQNWDIEFQGILGDINLKNMTSLVSSKIKRGRGGDNSLIYLPDSNLTGVDTVFSGEIYTNGTGSVIDTNLTRKRYHIVNYNNTTLSGPSPTAIPSFIYGRDTNLIVSGTLDVGGNIKYPEKVVSILEYGAIAGEDSGQGFNNFTAINNAIDSVSNSGGGVVFVPKGVYETTNVVLLRDNVILAGEGYGSEIRNIQNNRSFFSSICLAAGWMNQADFKSSKRYPFEDISIGDFTITIPNTASIDNGASFNGLDFSVGDIIYVRSSPNALVAQGNTNGSEFLEQRRVVSITPTAPSGAIVEVDRQFFEDVPYLSGDIVESQLIPFSAFTEETVVGPSRSFLGIISGSTGGFDAYTVQRATVRDLKLTSVTGSAVARTSAYECLWENLWFECGQSAFITNQLSYNIMRNIKAFNVPKRILESAEGNHDNVFDNWYASRNGSSPYFTNETTANLVVLRIRDTLSNSVFFAESDEVVGGDDYTTTGFVQITGRGNKVFNNKFIGNIKTTALRFGSQDNEVTNNLFLKAPEKTDNSPALSDNSAATITTFRYNTLESSSLTPNRGEVYINSLTSSLITTMSYNIYDVNVVGQDQSGLLNSFEIGDYIDLYRVIEREKGDRFYSVYRTGSFSPAIDTRTEVLNIISNNNLGDGGAVAVNGTGSSQMTSMSIALNVGNFTPNNYDELIPYTDDIVADLNLTNRINVNNLGVGEVFWILTGNTSGVFTPTKNNFIECTVNSVSGSTHTVGDDTVDVVHYTFSAVERRINLNLSPDPITLDSSQIIVFQNPELRYRADLARGARLNIESKSISDGGNVYNFFGNTENVALEFTFNSKVNPETIVSQSAAALLNLPNSKNKFNDNTITYTVNRSGNSTLFANFRGSAYQLQNNIIEHKDNRILNLRGNGSSFSFNNTVAKRIGNNMVVSNQDVNDNFVGFNIGVEIEGVSSGSTIPSSIDSPISIKSINERTTITSPNFSNLLTLSSSRTVSKLDFSNSATTGSGYGSVLLNRYKDFGITTYDNRYSDLTPSILILSESKNMATGKAAIVVKGDYSSILKSTIPTGSINGSFNIIGSVGGTTYTVSASNANVTASIQVNSDTLIADPITIDGQSGNFYIDQIITFTSQSLGATEPNGTDLSIKLTTTDLSYQQNLSKVSINQNNSITSTLRNVGIEGATLDVNGNLYVDTSITSSDILNSGNITTDTFNTTEFTSSNVLIDNLNTSNITTDVLESQRMIIDGGLLAQSSIPLIVSSSGATPLAIHRNSDLGAVAKFSNNQGAGYFGLSSGEDFGFGLANNTAQLQLYIRSGSVNNTNKPGMVIKTYTDSQPNITIGRSLQYPFAGDYEATLDISGSLYVDTSITSSDILNSGRISTLNADVTNTLSATQMVVNGELTASVVSLDSLPTSDPLVNGQLYVTRSNAVGTNIDGKLILLVSEG